jgi:EAL domain-containing protein (putative c-di-GMP-specific phosphodiesterase class I)
MKIIQLNRRSLSDALANKEFFTVFHPRFGLPRGKPESEAAVLQWRSQKAGGMVSAEAFHAVAAECGLAVGLLEYCLAETARRRRREALEGREALPASVRLQDAILARKGRFAAALPSVAQAANGFTLEIAVGGWLAMRASAGLFAGRLEALRETGADICLCLSNPDIGWLAAHGGALPVQAVKLEPGVLRAGRCSIRYAAYVRDLVALARSFGWKTVAGGVHTEADASTALLAGCDLGQGLCCSWTGQILAAACKPTAGRPCFP